MLSQFTSINRSIFPNSISLQTLENGTTDSNIEEFSLDDITIENLDIENVTAPECSLDYTNITLESITLQGELRLPCDLSELTVGTNVQIEDYSFQNVFGIISKRGCVDTAWPHDDQEFVSKSASPACQAPHQGGGGG